MSYRHHHGWSEEDYTSLEIYKSLVSNWEFDREFYINPSACGNEADELVLFARHLARAFLEWKGDRGA